MSWRAAVWIDGISNSGAETIEVTDTDNAAQSVAPAAGALRLVAPLRLGETIDDELWPAQPRSTASVSILANTAAELAMIRKGVQATVAFKTPSAAASSGDRWDWRLFCVVQSCQLRPHPSGGVVAIVQLVDHMVARLSNQDAGVAAWPAEAVDLRINRILGNNGFAGAWFGPSPTPAVTPNVAARAASRSTALELVSQYLREWVDTDGISAGAAGVVGRPFLVADVTDSSAWDIDNCFWQQWITYRLTKSSDLSANYTDPEGVSRAIRADIDPALVEFPGVWNSGSDQPTQVTATWNNGGVEDVNTKTSLDYADRPITATIATDLTANVAAGRVAALYLPDNGTTEWVAETFRYRLSEDSAAAPLVPRLGQIVVMQGIHAAHTPDGSGDYVGRLVSSELTIEGGQVYMDLTLRPTVLEFTSGASSRFWFSSTAPSVSPAYGATWDSTASAQRGILQASKPGSPGATSSVQVAEAVATNPYDVLFRQYVSTPFTVAGVIPAGTAMTAVLRVAESNAGMDAYWQLVVRVVDGAGVEQAVLYEDTAAAVSATAGANNQEAPTSGATRIKNVTTTTRVTVEEGWRLVVELGMRSTNGVTTNYTGTLYLPSTTASDYALLAGVTSDGSPWLEFPDRDVVP